MKKIWIGATVLVVLVIVVGIYFVMSNLNSIVAKVIEEQGGRVTATEVGVSEVDISLREGRATIAGLEIASPDRFAAPSAFSLGEITVDIDLESLREEPIVIEQILVRAPVVAAKFLESGSLNIVELRKNAERFVVEQGGAPAEKTGNQKRIRIKQFVFEKGRIEVDASELGMEKRTLDLPAIRIDEIGGTEGALPEEIAFAVLDALGKKAAAEIARSEIEQKVKDKVEDFVTEKAKGLLDKIGR